uniref:Uncharacterized protein n=1 Tax=uncultured bacterium Contig575 TaxID=1393592 RepID=W0FNL2_9BACT|nr:hypothetical protein [uncultured bacterium Contig575]
MPERKIRSASAHVFVVNPYNDILRGRKQSVYGPARRNGERCRSGADDAYMALETWPDARVLLRKIAQYRTERGQMS